MKKTWTSAVLTLALLCSLCLVPATTASADEATVDSVTSGLAGWLADAWQAVTERLVPDTGQPAANPDPDSGGGDPDSDTEMMGGYEPYG